MLFVHATLFMQRVHLGQGAQDHRSPCLEIKQRPGLRTGKGDAKWLMTYVVQGAKRIN